MKSRIVAHALTACIAFFASFACLPSVSVRADVANVVLLASAEAPLSESAAAEIATRLTDDQPRGKHIWVDGRAVVLRVPETHHGSSTRPLRVTLCSFLL